MCGHPRPTRTPITRAGFTVVLWAVPACFIGHGRRPDSPLILPGTEPVVLTRSAVCSPRPTWPQPGRLVGDLGLGQLADDLLSGSAMATDAAGSGLPCLSSAAKPATSAGWSTTSPTAPQASPTPWS